MELKDFTKKVLLDVTEAVKEARKESSYDMSLKSSAGNRTIEFDIAVSAEDTGSQEGKAGIRVLKFFEAGGKMGCETRNATVSRIKFGIYVNELDKAEQAKQDFEYQQFNDMGGTYYRDN